MNYIVQMEKLNFSYKNKEIFKNLNMVIERNKFTTILGINGSGKTTLLNLILGNLKGNSVILCDKLPVVKENFKVIRKDIGVVFNNPSDFFVSETVSDEIAFTLENLNLKPSTIKNKINTIAKLLEIKDLLKKEPHSLSNQDKWLVALASSLVHNPKLLLIDGGIEQLDLVKREKVLKVLKDLIENKNLSIIYFTANSEECLYGEKIVILDQKKVIKTGDTKEVLTDEEVFENASLQLPFIISLSNKLAFYNLIKEPYLNEKEMVNAIWK